MTIPDDIKVACAIGVAATIYQQIAKLKNDAYKLKRLKIASDAIDKTVPLNRFYDLYQNKSPAISDGDFLLENLSLLCLQPKELWPDLKVKAREWGEYTRPMAGLMTLLDTPIESIVKNKTQRQDVLGTLNFIRAVHSKISTPTLDGLNSIAEKLSAVP